MTDANATMVVKKSRLQTHLNVNVNGYMNDIGNCKPLSDIVYVSMVFRDPMLSKPSSL
jgi:hypothetical protein